jgi:hypothetical protein
MQAREIQNFATTSFENGITQIGKYKQAKRAK